MSAFDAIVQSDAAISGRAPSRAGVVRGPFGFINCGNPVILRAGRLLSFLLNYDLMNGRHVDGARDLAALFQ